MHYKAPDNSLHFLDNDSFSHVLPAGSIAITEAEAEALRPVPPPPGPPMTVTRRQARQALLLAGKLGLVQTAIDAIPDATQRGMMQIEWDDAQEFDRNRPSLIAIGGAIGLDFAGIDALFVQAAEL